MGYRTYSQDDFATFQRGYSNPTNPPDWFQRDFGKPNETVSKHAVWRTQLSSVWSKSAKGETTFLLASHILDDSGDPSSAHVDYGAPELLVTQLQISHRAKEGAPRVAATIWSVNKTSTRLPETMFVSFLPENAKGSLWEMKKLGQWQKTQQDVIAGGSKHLHGIG